MLRRLAMCAVAAVLLANCKGADGAMGPAGPVGPAGPTGATGANGAGNRLVLTVTGSGANGFGAVELPAVVGNSRSNPPAMTCYEGLVNGSVWFGISDGWSATSPYCALVLDTGKWYATATNLSAGRMAMFVIVY